MAGRIAGSYFRLDLMLPTRRRDFLRALGALGLSALPSQALSDHTAAAGAAADADFCGAGASGRPLFIPGASGLFGRLAPDGARFALRAMRVGAVDAGPWSLAFQV